MNPLALQSAVAAEALPAQAPQALSSAEEIGRVFNTALLGSLVAQAGAPSADVLGEIQRLMDTPAFHSLMSSIRHLARTQGVLMRWPRPS